MVDTARERFPASMARASEFPPMGELENFAEGIVDRVKDFAKDQPVAFGLWALGIGFVLGWKLKPW